MARYFNIPFANTGDKNDIPDVTQADGAVNYPEGYGPDYSLNPVTNPTTANRVERQIFNELLFQITDVLKDYYERAYPPYTSTITYAQYARVLFNNRIHESRINGNNTSPTNTTNWQLVDLGGLESLFYTRVAADARYLNESNNLSDLDNAGTARNNLNLGNSSTRNTGSSNGNIPLIGDIGASLGANSSVMVRSGSNSNGNFWVWSNGFTVMLTPRITATSINNFINTPTPLPINGGQFVSVVGSDTGDNSFYPIISATTITNNIRWHISRASDPFRFLVIDF